MTTESQVQQSAPEPSFDQSVASQLAEMHAPDREHEDDAPPSRATPDREPAHPDDAKQASAEPEPPQAEEEPTVKVKLKIDGKEEERTLKHSELASELQKSAAAQKRFEEAASVRKQAEAEGRQASQERAQLAQALQHFTAQLQASQPAPPDAALLNTDPVQYLQQQHAYGAWVQQAQQAQAAQAHLAQQEQAAAHESQGRYLAEQSAELVKALPEWSDPAKAKAGKESIRKLMESTGFSADEINSVADARVVRLAHKAAQYDAVVAELQALKAQQQKAQADLTGRLKGLPPVRAERPGSAEISSTDGRTRAMQSLNRTGSLTDAAVVLAGLL